MSSKCSESKTSHNIHAESSVADSQSSYKFTQSDTSLKVKKNLHQSSSSARLKNIVRELKRRKAEMDNSEEMRQYKKDLIKNSPYSQDLMPGDASKAKHKSYIKEKRDKIEQEHCKFEKKHPDVSAF